MAREVLRDMLVERLEHALDMTASAGLKPGRLRRLLNEALALTTSLQLLGPD